MADVQPTERPSPPIADDGFGGYLGAVLTIGLGICIGLLGWCVVILQHFANKHW